MTSSQLLKYSNIYKFYRRKKNDTYRTYIKTSFHVNCFFNNLLPHSFLDPHLELHNFICRNVTDELKKIHAGSSPGRKLSDIFWHTLPWNAIIAALGEVHILDTGCGDGNYGVRMMKTSENRIARYTGIDISKRDNWYTLAQQYPHFTFKEHASENIQSIIPQGTNFFMSQSAIEHFKDDKAYFNAIKNYIDGYNKPVLQIHIFPSRACYKTFGWHGHRQYSPRTVSKISRLFPNSRCILFGLGGNECNRVHYEYIQRPLMKEGKDYRTTKPQEYADASYNAILHDIKHLSANPAYHALVICSHITQKNF